MSSLELVARPLLDQRVIISLQRLNDRGDGGFFTSFMTIFLTGTEERSEQLTQGLLADDWQTEVTRVAHALKGSCGFAGAATCASLCSKIEDATQAGDGFRVRGLVAGLKLELGRVRTAIHELLLEQASWGLDRVA